MPGTGFYSLSSVQGTAHCISSVYFEVQGRRAHLTSEPAGFEEEGGASCGVGRWYGSIDGRPPQETPAGADPDSITEEDPLRMPYVHAGQLYAVSLGHFTIGWRYFADWSVRFDAIDDGKLVRRAAFAIGMTKGPHQSLRVESAAR